MTPFPSPKELLEWYPSSKKQKNFIEQSRITIQNILDSKDHRFLLIVGPCSIHDVKGALEFAKFLKNCQKNYGENLFIVMRAYLEKARTLLGWKGLIHDPYLDGSNQIIDGLTLARKFLLELAELEMPAACEFLDPFLSIYIEDLISWGCIGARTTSSQIHRQIASAFSMPIGFKNTTEGNVEIAINSILSASQPHTFAGLNEAGRLTVKQTEGNPYSHLILRGGESETNFDPQSVRKSLKLLRLAELPERLLVDCSHDNSEKKQELQPKAFHSVVQQHIEGNQNILGAMLESYLFSGNQHLNHKDLKYGISVTDSCLSAEDTESLMISASQKINECSLTLKCAQN